MNQLVDISQIAFADTLVAWIVIIFLFAYVFFSFLVIRQVGVMCSVVETPINNFLKLAARVQMLAGVAVLIIALVSLLI